MSSSATAIATDAGHSHPEHVAHHFDTAKQQFDTGKLGIWSFLFQEVLFFSGLFVAYAVYRQNHPEVFQFASQFLNTNLGAINTVVLLFSSFTAAWAVRAAQLGQKKTLITLLSVTILCAFGFMGIKYIEYSHKFHEGLLWGGAEHSIMKADNSSTTMILESVKNHSEAWNHPAGTNTFAVKDLSIEQRRKTGIFFGVYFCLTGLHGIHVIAGIFLMFWLLARAVRGDFGPQNFNAIDFGALYWHLVDLIWIFLFPLLYLIS